MKRTMFRSRLKPECVEEYVRLHREVWPELLDAYRKAGITRVGCYLNGLDLLVYSERDPEIYEREKDALNKNPVGLRWDKLMATLRDQSFGNHEFEEVFFMQEQAPH